MNTKEEILDFLHSNKDYLKKQFHLSKIGLFGSFARDEATKISDIDIIIELDGSVKNVYDLKYSLREYLSRAFERDVDIAREKYLNPYAKKEILRDALFV